MIKLIVRISDKEGKKRLDEMVRQGEVVYLDDSPPVIEKVVGVYLGLREIWGEEGQGIIDSILRKKYNIVVK